MNITNNNTSINGLQYYPKILNDDYAKDLLQILKIVIPFQKIKWSTNKYLPRLVYRYDDSHERLEPLEILKNMMETQFNIKISGIFCNYYADGNDYTPLHKDSYNCDVLTLSLGGCRRFQLVHDETKNKIEYNLENGDVIFFTQEVNDKYKHTILKTTKVVDERISLVFFVL